MNAVSRMYFSSSGRSKLAGMTSRLTKERRMAELPISRQFYARDCSFPIIWVREIIRFILNGIGGIGTCKAYTTSPLRLNDNTEEGQTSRREAKSCCVPSA